MKVATIFVNKSGKKAYKIEWVARTIRWSGHKVWSGRMVDEAAFNKFVKTHNLIPVTKNAA